MFQNELEALWALQRSIRENHNANILNVHFVLGFCWIIFYDKQMFVAWICLYFAINGMPCTMPATLVGWRWCCFSCCSCCYSWSFHFGIVVESQKNLECILPCVWEPYTQNCNSVWWLGWISLFHSHIVLSYTETTKLALAHIYAIDMVLAFHVRSHNIRRLTRL